MKIFISSTCYNLPDLRAELESFIIQNGHTPLLSDRDSFPVITGIHRHDVCLEAVTGCDLFVLIVDGRYGANYYGDPSISITHAEFKTALSMGINLIAFIREDVFYERQTYKKNANITGFRPCYVDDIRVFKLITDIQEHHSGPWAQPFKDVTNVKKLLNSIFESQKLGHQFQQKKQHVANTPRPVTTIDELIKIISKPAADFLAIINKKENESISDFLTRAINLIPDGSRTIGTLMDFEMGKYGISDYTYVLTIRPMDDDGSCWLCAEAATALGQSVRNELMNFK